MADSTITKKAIAQGFKEIMKEKSFDKITILDITKKCGLNRQTFYYHFQDKYELVDWIYFNEAIAVVASDMRADNWDQKVMDLLIKMKSDDFFYINTLRTPLESGFQEYLFNITKELFCTIVTKIHGKLNLESIDFIASFYAFGISGTVIFWARNGMKESPEDIVKEMRILSEGTQKFAASQFMKKNDPNLGD